MTQPTSDHITPSDPITQSGPAVGMPTDQRTLSDDKALATTGTDYWSTHPIPELGLRSIRVSDGPHGLRVQDDDNPDHLGLGRSLPATCFPRRNSRTCFLWAAGPAPPSR